MPTVKTKGDSQTGPQSVDTFTSYGRRRDAVVLDKRLPATYNVIRTITKQPTVALARALIAAPVVAARWSYETDDEVTDDRLRFIQDQLDPIREVIVQQAMDARIDYGWIGFEKVYISRTWEERDRIMIKRLKPLLHDLTYINVNAQSGAFEGFSQIAYATVGTTVELELPYSLLMSFGVEGTNWYGRSLVENIRRIYNSWEDSNEGAERYDLKMAGHHWIIYYPTGYSSIDGVETDNKTVATTIANALEASGTIIVPRKVAAQITDLNQQQKDIAQWEIELKEHAGQSSDFIARMAYCDKLMVRGLLSPERSILEGQFGTKAEAGVHAGLALTQRELEHRAIVRFINWYLVDQLLALNFGEEARGSVRVVAAPLSDERALFFQEVYKQVLGHPTESPAAIDVLDMDGLMDSLGLPKTEEVVQPGLPASPGAPGQVNIDAEMGSRIAKLYAAAGGNGRGLRIGASNSDRFSTPSR